MNYANISESVDQIYARDYFRKRAACMSVYYKIYSNILCELYKWSLSGYYFRDEGLIALQQLLLIYLTIYNLDPHQCVSRSCSAKFLSGSTF